LVAAQRDVLLGYLGTAPAPPLDSAITEPVPTLATAPAAEPGARAEPAAVPPAEPEAKAVGPEHIREVVLATVSARTGYPSDMLGADLDLEGDLSIDSIKRTEIIGELAERLGLGGDEADVEDAVTTLARIKTIGGIADWLEGHLSGPPETAFEGASAPTAGDAVAASGTPDRYIVQTVPAPAPPGDGDPLAGRRVVIVDDGRGVALELAELLEQRGADARVVETMPDDRPSGADALIHLAALRPGAGPVLPGAFAGIRRAVLDGADRLVLATASAATFGPVQETGEGETADAGIRGLIRAIGHEYPDSVVKAVDVDPKENPSEIAGHLLTELTGGDGRTVVGYRNGIRSALRVRRADLAGEATPPPGLDRDSVVLLTGGARGITAGVAIALARRTGCHVELIGRTPTPAGPEDPATTPAPDMGALRGVLARRGTGSPAEIDAAARRVLIEREMRATLDQLRGTASSVRYHPADIRDTDAVRAVVEDIYARHGRLDGIVHGAGALEDRLLGDKSPESFARVYGTKVDGYRALLDAIAPATGLAAEARPDVGFVVAFGSVAGAFGNRGQTDYAAANDALDTLSHVWAERLPGRVVTIDWGPWAGGGMVSPELEREYARRGTTLIDPEAGVTCLLRELSHGTDAQVIYMCGDVDDE
jgi:NAD(P)-dependent dehydrogenase (short-subunit alcohol dehydrogenase family)/acyl carrier protein